MVTFIISTDSINFVVYGRDNCRWCQETKKLLKEYGFKYTFVHEDHNNKKVLKLITNDYQYVPTIFISGIFLEGGYTELEKIIDKLAVKQKNTMKILQLLLLEFRKKNHVINIFLHNNAILWK
jgi:glutaredoxin